MVLGPIVVQSAAVLVGLLSVVQRSGNCLLLLVVPAVLGMLAVQTTTAGKYLQTDRQARVSLQSQAAHSIIPRTAQTPGHQTTTIPPRRPVIGMTRRQWSLLSSSALTADGPVSRSAQLTTRPSAGRPGPVPPAPPPPAHIPQSSRRRPPPAARRKGCLIGCRFRAASFIAGTAVRLSVCLSVCLSGCPCAMRN